MEKPNISRDAFWNVEFDLIDFQEDANAVIARVLIYGRFEDNQEIIRYYGASKVIEVINLQFEDIEFRRKFFHLPNNYVDNLTRAKIRRLNLRLREAKKFLSP